MEKSEPALAPQWLRSTGSVTGGGSSSYHFSPSFSTSDPESRKRNFRSRRDDDATRSPFLDLSSSANSRRGSSNGSVKHAYSSFNRSRRDKDPDRDRDRLNMKPQDHESSGSVVSQRRGDLLPQRVSFGLKNCGKRNHLHHSFGNDVSLPASQIGISFQKTAFEKDFPSLGSEDKHGYLGVARVTSPGLTSTVPSLPVGSSVSIGGEGWTSALAEVPNIVQKTVVGSSSSPFIGTASTGTTSGTSCLNMAKALVQVSPRTHILSEVSVKTQRLEELAIKHSRQLIPVTPSMPKVPGASTKSKIKPTGRTSEIGHGFPRNANQHLTTSPSSSQTHASGNMKPDSSKKLLVLKPARENGASTAQKDVTSSIDTNANGRAADNLLTVVPSVPVRSTNSSKECKPASSNMVPGFSLEKRLSLSQTRSRNDFFNLLKLRNSRSNSTDRPGSSENAEGSKVSYTDPSSPDAGIVIGDEQTNGDDSVQMLHKYSQAGDGNMSLEAVVYSDEEETAFLRSLGWEEHSGEDEGLTEEEIKAFNEQYQKLRAKT